MDDESFTIAFSTAVFGIVGLIEGFFEHKDFCDPFKELLNTNFEDAIPKTCETGIPIMTTSLSAYLALGFIAGVVYVSFNRWNNKEKKEKKTSWSVEESLTSKIEREKWENIEQSNKEELSNTEVVEEEKSLENVPIEDEIQLQKFAEHPGWLWDPLKAKWIPEGDALPENPPPPANWSTK